MKHELTEVEKREVKKKITAAIKLYHRDFLEEAEAFYDYVRVQRALLINEDGSHSGDHTIERALFEMPENLYNLVMNNLLPEEQIYFKTKEGGRWFAKTFSKYSLIPKELI